MQNMLLFVIKLLGIVSVVVILAAMVFGFWRTWQVQHSENQKIFLAGSIPNPMPDGLYKGTIGKKVSWVGKKFNASNSTGINSFDNNGQKSEKYPFNMYVDKGLADKNLTVLKIDYNITENPFWARIILDEIVQTSENTYLGKVMIKIIPRYPFALGYFNLVK